MASPSAPSLPPPPPYEPQGKESSLPPPPPPFDVAGARKTAFKALEEKLKGLKKEEVAGAAKAAIRAFPNHSWSCDDAFKLATQFEQASLFILHAFFCLTEAVDYGIPCYVCILLYEEKM